MTERKKFRGRRAGAAQAERSPLSTPPPCSPFFSQECVGEGNRLLRISQGPLILPDFTAPCSTTAIFIAVTSGSYSWVGLPSWCYGKVNHLV